MSTFALHKFSADSLLGLFACTMYRFQYSSFDPVRDVLGTLFLQRMVLKQGPPTRLELHGTGECITGRGRWKASDLLTVTLGYGAAFITFL
jgi:hypothetical protein